MTTMEFLQISPGSAVETRDGKTIGHVSEAKDAHFKVHVSWRRDFWLPTSIVYRATEEAIMLAVPKSELSGYRMARPAPDEMDVAAPHVQGPFSDEEMLYQRRRMERQIEDQRTNDDGW